MVDRSLVVFDLDRTLVYTNTSYEFSLFLYRRKLFSLRQLGWIFIYRIAFACKLLSLKQLHEKVFCRLLKGMNLFLLHREAQNFVDQFDFSSVFSPAYRALQEAQKRGDYTLILSASPDFLVEKIARYLRVEEWGGTVYGVDKDESLCNIAKLMDGTRKAACVQETAGKLKMGKERITAYSDSYDDLPLLMAAGCPIAVNPDSRLRSLAREKNWSII